MSKTFKDYLKETGLQYHTGVKKHGKKYMVKAAQAGRDGASQEELGRLKDKYSKAEKKTQEGFDRSSVTWEDLKPHVMLVQKKILMDIEEAEKEIADLKAGGDDGEPGGDIYEIEPYLRDLKDMLEYPKHILQNPKMDIETIVDHMMPTGLDTSVREDLIGRFKTVIGHKDPQLAKRLFMDPELDFYAQGKARDGALDGIKDSIDPELERIKELAGASIDETYDDDDDFYDAYGEMWYNEDDVMDEAEYQGRKVQLGKPMQGDVKKFKVYVKDPKTGNIKKVNFGHGGSSVKGKAMSIKKNNPKRRKSFRARHNCDNPGPRTKARYWSCRKW